MRAWTFVAVGLALAAAPAFANGLPSTSGGGWIVGTTGGKATFGFAADIRDATVTGHLVYTDHGAGLIVRSTAVTAVTSAGCTTTIAGDGDSNAGPVSFSVTVVDNGERGSTDVFTIQMTGVVAYTAAGVLGGGNVQVRGQNCP